MSINYEALGRYLIATESAERAVQDRKNYLIDLMNWARSYKGDDPLDFAAGELLMAKAAVENHTIAESIKLANSVAEAAGRPTL